MRCCEVVDEYILQGYPLTSPILFCHPGYNAEDASDSREGIQNLCTKRAKRQR